MTDEQTEFPKKSSKKKKGLIIIGAVVAVICVAVAIGLAFKSESTINDSSYEEAIMGVNNLRMSYDSNIHRLLDYDTMLGDYSDEAVQEYFNYSQHIRMLVDEMDRSFDELDNNEIFKKDPEAKTLFENFKEKYNTFRELCEQAIEVLEDPSQSLDAKSTAIDELTTNDLTIEIMELENYLYLNNFERQ